MCTVHTHVSTHVHTCVSMLGMVECVCDVCMCTTHTFGMFACVALTCSGCSHVCHAPQEIPGKRAACLLSPTAFTFGADQFGRYEGGNAGVTWANYWCAAPAAVASLPVPGLGFYCTTSTTTVHAMSTPLHHCMAR